MKVRKAVHATGVVVMLGIGLLTGSGSMGSTMTAEQAISAARTATQEAAKAGFEWRDTGSIIKDAEKALSEGKKDEALKLADEARQQAELALQQAAASARKFN
jgi:hypothetical protein